MEIITHLIMFVMGIVIGMYIATQIERDINKRIKK
tara:strand:- start:2301 stop:2405 length:105 start_codon:yes stop_codon:yes gene_type:complete